MSTPKLSKNAIKLLHQIYEGRFEPAYANGPIRKSLQELIDAQLLTTGGRVVKMARYYIPAKGFKGFVLDKMPAKPKWLQKTTGGYFP